MSKLRIGWIGTGVMGKSMCGHLMKAGYPVGGDEILAGASKGAVSVDMTTSEPSPVGGRDDSGPTRSDLCSSRSQDRFHPGICFSDHPVDRTLVYMVLRFGGLFGI